MGLEHHRLDVPHLVADVVVLANGIAARFPSASGTGTGTEFGDTHYSSVTFARIVKSAPSNIGRIAARA